MAEFKVGNRFVGDNHPTYFIADISANHDGDINRALDLCELAKKAGADCAKFQHFRAEHIVSERGFAEVGKLAHQAGWREDVVDAFRRLSVPWEWTSILKRYCDQIGIEFMSTPYDLECVDHLDPYVNAFKIGSGDITYLRLIDKIAENGKPVFIACGASDIYDVDRAMRRFIGSDVCLMQCNTNYTADPDNFKYLQLKTLIHFRTMYPNFVLGLSDHTIGYTAVMGAVALGARVIEKHFTDAPHRPGPDHTFSSTPQEWQEMVHEVRNLEAALGGGRKRVEANEQETVVLQRRCLRAARALKAGLKLAEVDFVALRPAPSGSLPPYEIDRLIGRVLKYDKEVEDAFRAGDFL